MKVYLRTFSECYQTYNLEVSSTREIRNHYQVSYLYIWTPEMIQKLCPSELDLEHKEFVFRSDNFLRES
jgi:hypothetical protein